MSFYTVEQLVANDAIVKQFVEAFEEETPRVPKTSKDITAAMPSIPKNDANWNYPRGRGILRKNDPLNQWKGDETSNDLNIVWITGMWSGAVPGTGRYAELLKPLGYNVRVIRTISDMKTAGLGRIVRHIPFKAVKNLHSKWASSHVDKNFEKVTTEINDQTEPDLIIGSSQGGAVALSIAPRYKDIPMILLCPAWKIFNVTPTYVNPESVIIHGIHDIEVPFEDSQELAQMFDIKLIPTKDGHILKQGMSVLMSQLHSVAPSLLKAKLDREREIDKQRVAVKQENTINLWIA